MPGGALVAGRRRCRVALRHVVAAIVVLIVLPASASAAITLTAGANTVSTPKFELDFDDGAGNVERLTTLQWRSGAGTLGTDLANEGGAGGAPCSGFTEFWGQSYATQDFAPPGPVVAGTTGAWIAAGTRTVEINGSAPTVCSGANPIIPVRTRYTFFDGGDAANMIRFERRFSFPIGSPVYGAINLRAFVPRLPIGTYGQVVYPNTGGTLTTTGTAGPSLSSNWNGTWVALNSGATNAGMVILRDPGNSETAKIVFDNDGSSGSNNSGVSLDKPAGGWQAPITETEYMCFYDATSWPVASRSPTSLPPGCSPRAVPVNTQVPTVSGSASSPSPGSLLSASPGSWEQSTGAFTYQWSRCEGASCIEIGGATNQAYMATNDDVGKGLKVRVTATSAVGEQDSAGSSATLVFPSGPAVGAGAAPDTTITGGPLGETRERTPAFSFSSSEPGSSFTCSLDGGTGVPCSSPFQTARLGAGSHSFEVRATSAAGGADPTPARREFRVLAVLADLRAPVLGRLLNVEPVRGVVTVAVPRGSLAARRSHAAQKGLRFVPLREAKQIPVGSFLNTVRGTVRLLAAGRGTQQGDFSSGLFQLLQTSRGKDRGVTELRLKGSSFSRCTARRSSSPGNASGREGTPAHASRRRLTRRTIRRLRGNAKGRFRTRGRYSSATVRGTAWLTSDRCDGTLTKVTRGQVLVRDLRRRRIIPLRAGRSYLAKAGR